MSPANYCGNILSLKIRTGPLQVSPRCEVTTESVESIRRAVVAKSLVKQKLDMCQTTQLDTTIYSECRTDFGNSLLRIRLPSPGPKYAKDVCEFLGALKNCRFGPFLVQSNTSVQFENTFITQLLSLFYPTGVRYR